MTVKNLKIFPYLNDISEFPNKQTLRLPSAIKRIRLHEPQKCSLIDVIKPNCPLKPGT